MLKDETRMELIKILEGSRRDQSFQTIISIAKEYEKYIHQDELLVADKAKVPADLPKVGPSTGKRKT